MSYKTLIIVDNSDTVTSLNQEIIRQTVKYILTNADDENSFALASVGSELSMITEYEDTLDTKYKSVETIEYVENVSSCKDALMEVITDWKENDFAGRDIILFSDGHEAENSYTSEELFFELNSSGYPVYVVECIQEDNAGQLKSLSSIARISKGGIFYTEFEGSDSSVEEKIGQGILTKMREYRNDLENMEDYVNQNAADDETYSLEEEVADKIYVENEYEGDAYLETNEGIIYEMPEKKTMSMSEYAFLIPVLLVIFIAVCLVFLINSRRRKAERAEEEKLLNSLKSSMNNKKINKNEIKNEYATECETRSLSEDFDQEDGGTRLLYETAEGVDITLEDRADPTKYFRAFIRDRIVIGRSKQLCDVALPYDDSVSSRHCEMFLRGEDLYVRDLSSSNGTSVNQQKVYQEIKLNSGDILKMGQLSMYVQIIRRGSFVGL